MKTYWFTIADGAVYQMHAERLRQSLKAAGVTLTILTSEGGSSQEAKYRKITGILAAPASCERIVYLDADTLVLDVEDIQRVNGAWRIPWQIPVEGCLPKTLEPGLARERLKSFYRHYGLSAFEEGGNQEGVEWNSGVIIGERSLMIALAQEWEVWWRRILDLFDGHFRRDQLSFRIAYHHIINPRYPAGLPAEYNWIASYFGINPNAHILHRTMVRRVAWLEDAWERIAQRRLAGEPVRTANRYFDGSGGTTGRPSLERQVDVDRVVEGNLLQQTLRFSHPNQVLLWGCDEEDQRFLPLVREETGGHAFVTALERLPEEADLAHFDFVLFCGIDYTLSEAQRRRFAPDTVFCFTGLHDMALYEHLYQFGYVRILDHGFGVFSNSARICDWVYTHPGKVSSKAGAGSGTG